MSINQLNNTPDTPLEVDSSKQRQPNRYPFLHNLAKSARTAVLLAAGAILSNVATGCSDQNPTELGAQNEPPKGESAPDGFLPPETDTALIAKDTAAEVADVCDNDEPKSVTEKLKCLTRGFYDPSHPQSVIGHFPNINDLRQYDTDRRPVDRAWGAVENQHKEISRIKKLKIKPQAKKNRLRLAQDKLNRLIAEAKRLQEKFDAKYHGRRPGKIAIFQRQPLTALKHIAVGDFLSDAVDAACGKAGLTPDECLLYHVMLFENSGGLWKRSLAGAIGPSQIMHHWFTLEKNLTDGLSTENFWEEPGFDGRYDPIANIEMGARILKGEMKSFGRNHPDFATLAFNQGSGAVRNFTRAWKEKHKISADLAEMLEDTKLSKKFMPTDNGGRGYVSKILAMQEISANPAKFGIEKQSVEDLPIKTNADGKVLYKWDEAFEPLHMPSGESLRKFAEKHGMDLGQLLFLNRQFKNPDAKFSRQARAWVLRKNTPVPEALVSRMTQKVPTPKVTRHPAKKPPSRKIHKRSGQGRNA